MPDAAIYVFLFVIIISNISCTPASGNADENINGETLYDVGLDANITMLKIIGIAMINLKNDLKEEAKEICSLHPCDEWTTWSDCDVSSDKHGRVGFKSRTRTCGGNTTFCKRYGISSLVYDSDVCENLCPDDYSLTRYGFCLKYYPGKKNWDEAENVCRNDGGHLVHVDSEMKVYDVNMTLAANPSSGTHVWIDGRKPVQGASWSYGYKSADPSFTFWSDNDPDNGATELCIMYHHEPSADNNMWRWYDFPCNYKFPFVCQIL